MKFGSTIRPELGRMDFSGIERGGRAAAEAIMRGSERLGAGIQSAGASIGGAIQQYQENKIFDAALTGEIETSISGNPTTLAYLEGQAEQKTDIGKAYQRMIDGSASRADKTMLAGSLKALDRISQQASNANNLRAAMVAIDNAFPATESGENQFDSGAYFQAFSNAGGTDPGIALRVMEQMRLSGNITVPQTEAEKAKTEAEQRRLDLQNRETELRLAELERLNTPTARAEAARLREEQATMQDRLSESQIQQNLAQAEAAKALAEQRKTTQGDVVEPDMGSPEADREIRQAERGQEIPWGQYLNTYLKALDDNGISQTHLDPKGFRNKIKRIPVYDRIIEKYNLSGEPMFMTLPDGTIIKKLAK